MNGSARKRLLEVLNCEHWRVALERLGEEACRGLISQAVGTLCSQEPLLRWRAVEAVGFLVSKLAARDPEAARDVVRRLLWSLNEDSGSIGWGAPEALAEILARDKAMVKEFLPMYISFLEPHRLKALPSLLAQGFLWGAFRLGELYGEILGKSEILKGIQSFLGSPEASLRGMAVLALKRLQALESLSGPLGYDPEFFSFMYKGELYRMSISQALRLPDFLPA